VSRDECCDPSGSTGRLLYKSRPFKIVRNVQRRSATEVHRLVNRKIQASCGCRVLTESVSTVLSCQAGCGTRLLWRDVKPHAVPPLNPAAAEALNKYTIKSTTCTIRSAVFGEVSPHVSCAGTFRTRVRADRPNLHCVELAVLEREPHFYRVAGRSCVSITLIHITERRSGNRSGQFQRLCNAPAS